MSSEGNFVLVYFEYILEPVLYYFYLSKEVDTVLLPVFLHKHLYLYLSKECVYFCHLCVGTIHNIGTFIHTNKTNTHYVLMRKLTSVAV